MVQIKLICKEVTDQFHPYVNIILIRINLIRKAYTD